MTIRLDPHTRGDTFEYDFELSEDWEGVDFADVIFTLRKKFPESNVTDDTDDDVVDQASVSSGEITFVGADGHVEIPASRTHGWPAQRLYWDTQVHIAASPENKVKTISRGDVLIFPDVTRSGPIDS